jgi:RNA polymerase sigma factor (sigma-70 family)
MTAADVTRTIDAIWRIESARLIAGVARLVRDVGLAEDLAQDALVSALDQWPRQGIPDNPGAWLAAVAKRRAMDTFRRNRLAGQKHDELSHTIDTQQQPELDAALDDDVGDDLLGLTFTACHPVLSEDSRTALTLRLVGGLTTQEIARAFLVSEAAAAQRIVRAKRQLADAGIRFERPRRDERTSRLPSVLEVVYLIFNEGYSATASDDWIRPPLCEEAMRLGRILTHLAPENPEVHGLLALMAIQASRLRARVGPGGEPILLAAQNRAHWDHHLIRHGLAALERARGPGGVLGPYALQAEIAACHARAATAAETNWARIAALYAGLLQITPSPIVELNRAVALGMAFGPEAGMQAIEPLMGQPALKNYHLLPAVRGDLCEKLGRLEEARAEYERAALLTRNGRERALMLERAAAVARLRSGAELPRENAAMATPSNKGDSGEDRRKPRPGYCSRRDSHEH